MSRRFGREITNIHQISHLNLSLLKKDRSISSSRYTTRVQQFDSNNVWEQISIDKRNTSLHSRRCEDIPTVRQHSQHSHRPQTVRFCDVKQLLQLEHNKQQVHLLDQQHSNNPQYITQYAWEIQEYLKSVQSGYIPTANALDKQPYISTKMRSILVDWIIDVSHKFKIKQDTLHLTINLLDRYLSTSQVQRNQFQLVGVAALLIASKIEEIYPPRIKDLTYITESSCSHSQIIHTESLILEALQFQLTGPTILTFLQRYQSVCPLSLKHFYISQFLVELYLLQNPQEYQSNIIAASAFYCVRKLKRYSPLWNNELEIVSSTQVSQLKQVCRIMYELMNECQSRRQIGNSFYSAVQNKYSQVKYYRLATINNNQ